MGKENITGIVKDAKRQNGSVTLKLSSFCDKYDESKKYAGMIVYAVDGKYKWKNSAGYCNGWNGRFGYIVIKCTDDWKEEKLREAGQGRVHHYLLKEAMGHNFAEGRVSCGGFAVQKGTLHTSSVWLNQNHQTSGKSDGSKYLSKQEKRLVEEAVKFWKAGKKNFVFDFPQELAADMGIS